MRADGSQIPQVHSDPTLPPRAAALGLQMVSAAGLPPGSSRGTACWAGTWEAGGMVGCVETGSSRVLELLPDGASLRSLLASSGSLRSSHFVLLIGLAFLH